ncbi:MAG: hypothetical protein EOO11_12430 [Chitinophagaceae bacterium]|nr:MAG: hypothetical protein EOO11_12430 [Chitinophagaceae bacterium]
MAPAVPGTAFTEEFDTVANAFSRGWTIKNATEPRGSGIWQQGGEVNPWFSAFSNNGSNAGFIGVNTYSTAADEAIISNWLISPEVTFQNGDKISFYTRAVLFYASATDSSDYGNSLELRMSVAGSRVDVGSGATVGVFDMPMLAINSSLLEAHSNPALFNPNAFPTNWTRFEATVTGVSRPTRGRFAFRYYVPGGGLGATAPGSGIAIDKVEYSPASR